MDTQVAYLLAISFYLTLPSSQSQSTQSGPWKRAWPPLVRRDQGAGPPASLPIQDRYEEEENTHVFPQKHHARLGQDNKLNIFIAAAVGTMTLMGVVYCIYSQFYSKKLFSHTQLEDDTELMLDLPGSSYTYFSGYPAMMNAEKGTCQAGYGSICDPPSIINIPPAPHSSPPLAAKFPPFCQSTSTPLQTISAQNLERSFV
ncbi:hypothetical protein SKAU_G00130800 [Synaphobranchus kaupii]|uniref:Uncharacterized protein n=1 Tax=Synaphobranchus kaupii TaxID=118154 RepID=A0A9Q1J2B5_SYNKA|nr:hypothetical protein SKAU_G00130800 [Synaphobranchus kaupii]